MTTLERQRAYIKDRLKQYGADPDKNSLQWKWRNPNTLPETYDPAEATTAILDALVNQGGIVAWDGDGVACVEQIVRAVWNRPRKA